jgi:hypothetical protein
MHGPVNGIHAAGIAEVIHLPHFDIGHPTNRLTWISKPASTVRRTYPPGSFAFENSIGGVRPVKSQSISEIVRAFVDRGKPNHALVALGLILLATIILVLAPLLLLR